ncbi:hypothetical protein HK104_000594 [Borealophlyctis nickersoniae]|nr:hypothetical protein HK104_000594 [Borealophlyctis nickersoniae]
MAAEDEFMQTCIERLRTGGFAVNPEPPPSPGIRPRTVSVSSSQSVPTSPEQKEKLAWMERIKKDQSDGAGLDLKGAPSLYTSTFWIRNQKKDQKNFMLKHPTIGPICISVTQIEDERGRRDSEPSNWHVYVRSKYGYILHTVHAHHKAKHAARYSLRTYLSDPLMMSRLRETLKEKDGLDPDSQVEKAINTAVTLLENTQEVEKQLTGTRLNDFYTALLAVERYRSPDHIIVNLLAPSTARPNSQDKLWKQILSLIGNPAEQLIRFSEKSAVFKNLSECVKVFMKCSLEIYFLEPDLTFTPKQNVPDNVRPGTTLDEGKRNQIIKEIVSTETSYLCRMRVLKEIYHDGVVSHYGELSLESPSFAGRQVPNPERIIQQSTRFLDQLNAETALTPERFAVIFANMVGPMEKFERANSAETVVEETRNAFFRAFEDYGKKYEDAARMWINMKETLPGFFHRCQDEAERTRNVHLTMKDLSIEPIQRITRYALTLTELLKATPIGHPGRELLEEALAKAKWMADTMNEISAKVESVEFRFSLDRALGAGGELTTPNLNFLYEFRVTSVPNNEQIAMLLFNGTLVILKVVGKEPPEDEKLRSPATPSPHGNQEQVIYELKFVFDYTRLSVVDGSDVEFRLVYEIPEKDRDPEKHPYSLEVLVYRADSKQEKRTLLRVLRHALLCSKYGIIPRAKSPHVKKEYEWFADSFADSSADFDVYYRLVNVEDWGTKLTWERELGLPNLILCTDTEFTANCINLIKDKSRFVGLLRPKDDKYRLVFKQAGQDNAMVPPSAPAELPKWLGLQNCREQLIKSLKLAAQAVSSDPYVNGAEVMHQYESQLCWLFQQFPEHSKRTASFYVKTSIKMPEGGLMRGLSRRLSISSRKSSLSLAAQAAEQENSDRRSVMSGRQKPQPRPAIIEGDASREGSRRNSFEQSDSARPSTLMMRRDSDVGILRRDSEDQSSRERDDLIHLSGSKLPPGPGSARSSLRQPSLHGSVMLRQFDSSGKARLRAPNPLPVSPGVRASTHAMSPPPRPSSSASSTGKSKGDVLMRKMRLNKTSVAKKGRSEAPTAYIDPVHILTQLLSAVEDRGMEDSRIYVARESAASTAAARGLANELIRAALKKIGDQSTGTLTTLVKIYLDPTESQHVRVIPEPIRDQMLHVAAELTELEGGSKPHDADMIPHLHDCVMLMTSMERRVLGAVLEHFRKVTLKKHINNIKKQDLARTLARRIFALSEGASPSALYAMKALIRQGKIIVEPRSTAEDPFPVGSQKGMCASPATSILSSHINLRLPPAPPEPRESEQSGASELVNSSTDAPVAKEVPVHTAKHLVEPQLTERPPASETVQSPSASQKPSESPIAGSVGVTHNGQSGDVEAAMVTNFADPRSDPKGLANEVTKAVIDSSSPAEISVESNKPIRLPLRLESHLRQAVPINTNPPHPSSRRVVSMPVQSMSGGPTLPSLASLAMHVREMNEGLKVETDAKTRVVEGLKRDVVDLMGKLDPEAGGKGAEAATSTGINEEDAKRLEGLRRDVFDLMGKFWEGDGGARLEKGESNATVHVQAETDDTAQLDTMVRTVQQLITHGQSAINETTSPMTKVDEHESLFAKAQNTPIPSTPPSEACPEDLDGDKAVGELLRGIEELGKEGAEKNLELAALNEENIFLRELNQKLNEEISRLTQERDRIQSHLNRSITAPEPAPSSEKAVEFLKHPLVGQLRKGDAVVQSSDTIRGEEDTVNWVAQPVE